MDSPTFKAIAKAFIYEIGSRYETSPEGTPLINAVKTTIRYCYDVGHGSKLSDFRLSTYLHGQNFIQYLNEASGPDHQNDPFGALIQSFQKAYIATEAEKKDDATGYRGVNIKRLYLDAAADMWVTEHQNDILGAYHMLKAH